MNKIKLRQTSRNGKTWYVLTLGEYSSSLNARQASKKLNKQLTELKPWIRKLDKLSQVG